MPDYPSASNQLHKEEKTRVKEKARRELAYNRLELALAVEIAERQDLPIRKYFSGEFAAHTRTASEEDAHILREIRKALKYLSTLDSGSPPAYESDGALLARNMGWITESRDNVDITTTGQEILDIYQQQVL